MEAVFGAGACYVRLSIRGVGGTKRSRSKIQLQWNMYKEESA